MSTFVPKGAYIFQGYQVRAAIRAFGLTTCNGQAAYQRVTWWFPSKGETFASTQGDSFSRYNLCDGS